MDRRVRLPAAGLCVPLLAAIVAVWGGGASAAQAAQAPDALVGAPETGLPGITETVDEIMARDRSSDEETRPEALPRFDFDLSKKVHLAAPLGSEWPTASASLLKAITEPSLPQTVGTSFRTLGLPESGFIPPDTAGDVGPTQILVHVNGRIRVYGKTGLPGALNASALTFWSSVANSSQPVFPQVRYDRLSGRWILTAVNSTKPNNRVMIAVQTTPGTITGSSSFTFYQFNQGSGGGSGDASHVCDSPTLGIDNNALYIGCNMFTTGGALSRITVYVVRKSSVIPAPGTLVVTAFRDISNGFTGPGPFAPVGVDNDDAQATEGYFVGVDIGTLGLLQIRKVSDPGGTPTLSGNLSLTVLATTPPIPQPASGSVTNIDSGDDRLVKASIHRNKITGQTTLWTSQTNEVDASCSSVAGGGRNGARWYEITGSAPTPADPLGGTPTLVQSGTLCDAAASSPQGYIYPSVVATGQGHMALGSSFAAANLFAGAAAAGRLRFDAAGATQAATTLQSGLASYTFVAAGRNRWGDYSFTDVDPIDDQTVWTFQEYADTPANNWAVRAVQLKAPPPPSLTGVQAVVCFGLPSTVVTLTGTGDAPVPGAEFFDPGPDTGGPGYSNHLSASATGGVTVNGAPSIVLPASPSTQPVLQVTLALNTTAAAAGLKDITIRNPDGQTTTGVGVVRVDHPSAPAASNNGPICVGATLQLSVETVPGAAYTWSGPDGFSSSLQNPTIPVAALAAAGTYTVTFSGTGCAVPPSSTTVLVIGETLPCEDGNVCTTGDTCSGGSCQPGSAVVCNDNSVCTADTCNPATGCVYTDTTAVTCDDGNVCTNDECHPVSGCFHTNNTAPCNDGNACTTGDTCGGGSCQPGTATVCNDDNACTVDSCTPATGCVFTDNSAACNDGNVCTADTCNPATGCVYTDTTAVTCNDGNVCTNDECNPVSGCFHTGNAGPCEDGDACTTGDTCGGGSCQPGTAVVCNDNNVCTADSCAPASGCVYTDTTAVTCSDGNVCTNDECNPVSGCFHTNNTGSCEDGDACTAGDTCSGGSCQTGTAVDCNDNNACTNDSCNPASGCVFAANTVPCDDGNACTTGDICGGGSCQPGTALACDDGLVCTDDSCNPATGCTFRVNTAACDDGNACTTGDTCGNGTCQPGTPVVCNDGNVCTDDVCETDTGCAFYENAASCEDGNACTAGDTCGGGSCQPGAPVVCNDNSVCTADSCNPATGCVYTDTTATTCNDGDVCTNDECNPISGCFHTNNVASCDDGNACTTGDTCGGGSCQPGTATVCNDDNACTVDSCNSATGCVFTDNSAACNDGNVCTADTCNPASGCVHTDTTAITCNDNNICTDDSCNPATGCVNTNNAASCDDGNACTAGDTCGGGSCQPGAPVVCNDNSVCTADSCNPAVGCVYANITAVLCNDNDVCTNDECNPVTGCFHSNNTAPCDDGNACTNADTCSAGTCSGVLGPPLPIQGVSLTGHVTTTLSWIGQAGNPNYDVATSTLADLRVSGTSGATCLANDVAGTSTVDTQPNPAAGQGYYYLIRAQGACGTGTYGFSSAGVERIPTAACP